MTNQETTLFLDQAAQKTLQLCAATGIQSAFAEHVYNQTYKLQISCFKKTAEMRLTSHHIEDMFIDPVNKGKTKLVETCNHFPTDVYDAVEKFMVSGDVLYFTAVLPNGDKLRSFRNVGISIERSQPRTSWLGKKLGLKKTHCFTARTF